MTTDDVGSAGSGSASAEPAWWLRLATVRPHRAKHRQTSWQAWRRSRPFGGGMLLLFAGLELVGIPLLGVLGSGHIKLVIYIGIGGVFGVLIGVLLMAAGIMLWVNPAHRAFYGIAGIALGIASFPASNLGGFFLGMLLAIIGGSLGFAWTPVAAPPVPAAPGGSATGDGAGHAAGEPASFPAGDETPAEAARG